MIAAIAVALLSIPAAASPAQQVPANADGALLAPKLGAAVRDLRAILLSLGPRLPGLAPTPVGHDLAQRFGADLLDDAELSAAGIDLDGAAAAYGFEGAVIVTLPLDNPKAAAAHWSAWKRVDPKKHFFVIVKNRLLVGGNKMASLRSATTTLEKDRRYHAASAGAGDASLFFFAPTARSSPVSAIFAALHPSEHGLHAEGRFVAANTREPLFANAQAPSWKPPAQSLATLQAALGVGGARILNQLLARQFLFDVPPLKGGDVALSVGGLRGKVVQAPAADLKTSDTGPALSLRLDPAKVLGALDPLSPLDAFRDDRAAALVAFKLAASPLLRAMGPITLTSERDAANATFVLDIPLAP